MNVGTEIDKGSENTYLQIERVTVGAGGTIAPTVAPQNWLSLGKVGWYKTDDSDDWASIEFDDDGVATVASLAQGTEVCVRFNGQGNVSQITVPSNFIPDTVTLYMTMPLFAAASANAEDIAKGTQLGEVVKYRYAC